jgi:hypothetical protein
VLPNSEDIPPCASEPSEIPLVALAIRLNLVSPKWLNLVLPARIAKPVPEITVKENSQFMLVENQVGTSG